MMGKRYSLAGAVLGGVILAVILTATLFLYIFMARPSARAPAPGAFAALTITPAWTSTPSYLPPTFTPPPQPTFTSTPLPGALAIGVYVEINGTGVGLRVRAAPGLDAAPLFIAADSEVFQITDGPRQADGYTWWHLVAPYDATRAGWAVQDYLQPIPPP